MRIFTKDNALTPSWDFVKPSIALLKKYIWQVMYLAFLPSLLATAALVLLGMNSPETAATGVSDSRTAAGLALLIAAIIWSILAYPGYIYMQLKAIRGQDVSIKECFTKGLKSLGSIVGTMLLTAILVILGLFAFVIPGLILIRGFMLAPYYVVDQKLGPAEAMKRSFQDSKINSAWIWGIIGVSMVFGIIGSLLGEIPVIGIVLSTAIALLYAFAPAMRYTEVSQKKKLNIEKLAPRA